MSVLITDAVHGRGREGPVATRTARGAAQPKDRTPLSRERVLRAAVDVADAGGVESLTMRRVAEPLGAEAMSLYHYVAGKEDLLDGVVDMVVQEINAAVALIDLPTRGAAWKPATRRRILTAREVFLRHPWAPAIFQSRTTPPPSVLKYFDALIGIMRDGGISYDLAHHAIHALGSRALGFTLELFNPGAGAGDEQAAAFAQLADRLPHLVGMIQDAVHDDPDSMLGFCDDQAEFEFGLDLVLDGLDRMRDRDERV